MTRKETAIWIDLTDLFYWRGHFTGIQRVSYNYGLRYSQKNARFFVYSSYYKRIVEVPFEIVREVVRSEASASPKARLKKTLKNGYETMPEKVQKISEPSIRKSLHWYRRLLGETVYKAGSQKMLRNMPTAELAQKDKVLILGAGWNEANFMSAIVDAKRRIGFEMIVHLNDILPVYMPQLFAKDLPGKFGLYVQAALKNADMVMTISNASKSDITRYFAENKLAPKPVKVIRLGEDINISEPQKPQISGLADEFVLAIGTFEIRKNYLLLYQAIKLAKAENKKIPQIIIVGRRGWLNDDLGYLLEKDPETREGLLHISGLSDENLAWLYANCLFTVFPSLAEGWGLPIAESVHYGKFCLSSNAEPMPEIAGKLIDYFSPFDPRDCLEKILEYSNDKTKLETKTKKLLKEYRPYSWEDSFKDLRSFIEERT